jgi:hypothetical protein
MLPKIFTKSLNIFEEESGDVISIKMSFEDFFKTNCLMNCLIVVNVKG